MSSLYESEMPSSIRKQVDELNAEDFHKYPLWEYCLDEEGVDGQDECTVRPVVGLSSVSSFEFFGVIAVTLKLANGKEFLGTFTLAAGSYEEAASYDASLRLGRKAQSFIAEPLPTGYNQIIYADAETLEFRIGRKRVLSEDKTRVLIDFVYKVLGTTADGMWPITVTPRVPIRQWPQSWSLHGWRRYAEPGGSDDIVR